MDANLPIGVSARGSFVRTSGAFCLAASLLFSPVADLLTIFSGLVAVATVLSILASYSLSVILRSSYLRSSAVLLDGRGFPEALRL
jgi:hypothetical protein